MGGTVGDRVLPEFGADGERVRRQRGADREHAVEPGEERVGLVGVEDRLLDRDQRAVGGEFEHHPAAAVRRDTDEGLTKLARAVGEIVGHAAHDVGHFAAQVALGLEHRPADQRVDAAGDDRRAHLEVQRRSFRSELLDEKFLERRLDVVVVGRTPGEIA